MRDPSISASIRRRCRRNPGPKAQANAAAHPSPGAPAQPAVRLRRAGAPPAPQGQKRSARRSPPSSACRDRHAEPRRLDRPDGRRARRSRAEGLSRDHRPEEPELIRLFSPSGRRTPIGPRPASSTRERRQDAEPRHRLDGRRQDADPRPAGDADLGQRRGPGLQARHRGRRQVHVHDHRFGRERAARPVDAAALWPDPAARQARGRRLFGAARGLCRRASATVRCRRSPTPTSTRPPASPRPTRATAAGSASPTNTGPRRSFPSRPLPIEARFSASGAAQPEDYQTDFLGPGRPSLRAPRRNDDARLRRRERSQHDRRLPDQVWHQEVQSDDRLGLVLFHHPADVLADRRDLQIRRQFRRRDPDRDRARQARLLPARQPQLPVDGENEEDPAADRRAEGPLSRRRVKQQQAQMELFKRRGSIRSPAACRW